MKTLFYSIGFVLGFSFGVLRAFFEFYILDDQTLKCVGIVVYLSIAIILLVIDWRNAEKQWKR